MDKRDGFRVETGDDILFAAHSGAMSGRMSNLSSQGCHILYEGPGIEIGETVEVTLLQGVSVPGTIAWRDQGEFGVHFQRKLGEATVRYFRLGDWGIAVSEQPKDSFGRPMPPLAHGFGRRATPGAS